MRDCSVKVLNKAGLHMRAAATLAKIAEQFQSEIFLEKDQARLNAKSVMMLISAGAAKGTEFTLIADGDDEEEALKVIAKLFENRFEEE